MIVTAYFSESGLPKTGLSPTVDIIKISDNSVVVNDGAMTEVGQGFYKYTFSGYDVAEDYNILCDSVSLTGNERYAIANINNEIQDLITRTKGLDDIHDDLVTIDGIADDILADTDTMEADLKTYLDTIEDNIRGADNDDLKDISDEIATITVDNDAIADAVWNEAKTDHTGDLKTIADNIDQSLSTTESNIRGVDSDTLETLSDQIDSIPTSNPSAATIADTVLTELVSDHEGTSGSLADVLSRIFKISKNRWKWDDTNHQWIIYDDDESTPLYTFDLKDINGDAVTGSTAAYERTPA